MAGNSRGRQAPKPADMAAMAAEYEARGAAASEAGKPLGAMAHERSPRPGSTAQHQSFYRVTGFRPELPPEDEGQLQAFDVKPYERQSPKLPKWADLPESVRTSTESAMAAMGFTPEGVRRNVAERFHEGIEAVPGSENWYPQASRETAEMARGLVIRQPAHALDQSARPENVYDAAVRGVAASSVRNRWDTKSGGRPNLEAVQGAARVLSETPGPPAPGMRAVVPDASEFRSQPERGLPIPGINEHVRKAALELAGEEALSGQKVESFHGNILRPHHRNNRATMDTIAARGALRADDKTLGKVVGMKRTLNGQQFDAGYLFLEEQHRQVAKDVEEVVGRRVPVEAVQAPAWIAQSNRDEVHSSGASRPSDPGEMINPKGVVKSTVKPPKAQRPGKLPWE